MEFGYLEAKICIFMPAVFLRNKDNVLEIDDVITFCHPISQKDFDAALVLEYYTFDRAVKKISTFGLQLLTQFHSFEVGDIIIDKDILSLYYNIELTVLESSLYRSVVRDPSGSSLLVNNKMLKKKAFDKCVCEFFTREAYGCTCGRIVG